MEGRSPQAPQCQVKGCRQWERPGVCAEAGHVPKPLGDSCKALALTGQPTQDCSGGSAPRGERLSGVSSAGERALSNEPDTAGFKSWLCYFWAQQSWTSWSLGLLI